MTLIGRLRVLTECQRWVAWSSAAVSANRHTAQPALLCGPPHARADGRRRPNRHCSQSAVAPALQAQPRCPARARTRANAVGRRQVGGCLAEPLEGQGIGLPPGPFVGSKLFHGLPALGVIGQVPVGLEEAARRWFGWVWAEQVGRMMALRRMEGHGGAW